MNMLRSRLIQIYKEEKYNIKQSSIVGNGSSISWGNQMRSVVMQPYQLVKDHRTGWETGNVSLYLQGDHELLSDVMLEGLRLSMTTSSIAQM